MRRTERLPLELSVTWNRAGREIPCTAVDVSAHGLFLRTDEIVEPESLMHLRVRLPRHVVEMFVTARFVGPTVRGRGIGVEMFLIDDVSNCRWVSFYEHLCAEQARSRKSVAMGA
ncbi:MAG: PilZ domain [bacterium]|nr:PilZ domain [bacterium]